MAGTPTQQYCPLSDDEVTTPAGLSVRFGRDVANGINNALWYVGAHKLVSEIAPAGIIRTPASDDAQNVIRVFAPRYVAPHFTHLSWRITSRMHGSATGITSWQLVCSSKMYVGSAVLDYTKLSESYTIGSLDTTSTSYAQSAVGTLAIDRSATNDVWLLLVGTNDDVGASEYGWITTLDVVPSVL